jgi:hypothetical protein
MENSSVPLYSHQLGYKVSDSCLSTLLLKEEEEMIWFSFYICTFPKTIEIATSAMIIVQIN